MLETIFFRTFTLRMLPESEPTKLLAHYETKTQKRRGPQTDKHTEYIFYCKRAILFLSSSKILTPHPPLRPASLSSPRNKGGGYTLERGIGGQYFGRQEKQDCPLTVKYVLCEINSFPRVLLQVVFKKKKRFCFVFYESYPTTIGPLSLRAPDLIEVVAGESRARDSSDDKRVSSWYPGPLLDHQVEDG